MQVALLRHHELHRLSGLRSGTATEATHQGPPTGVPGLSPILESRVGRNIDSAFACSLTVLLLLFPMNLLPLMTVHIGSIERSSLLASGLMVAWRQGWPAASIVLGLEAVVLPFVRFGLLSATLGAIRFGWRGRWVGSAFDILSGSMPGQ